MKPIVPLFVIVIAGVVPVALVVGEVEEINKFPSRFLKDQPCEPI